jgi:hypothetical protein
MTAIEAVTFDYWNTLVYELRGHLRGRRLEAWSGLLEEAGFAHERLQLEAVYDAAWDAYVTSWRANQQFRVSRSRPMCALRWWRRSAGPARRPSCTWPKGPRTACGP